MTIKDIRPALRGYLLADGAIAAVVVARIFPVKMPQGNLLACIVYNRISGQDDMHMQGPSGLVRSRIQIDCWAPTHDAASALANLVKERLNGARDDFEYGSNSPRDSVVVQGVFPIDDRDGYDDASKLYSVGRDYFVWFSERG